MKTDSLEIATEARSMYDRIEARKLQNWHDAEDNRKFLVGCLIEMAEYGRIVERKKAVSRKKKED
jgi:hypothetical protein